jgi:ABC-2 type transport system ATP-binding protein
MPSNANDFVPWGLDLIRCDQVSVQYGPFTALQNFSLSLAPGSCSVLIGPNGAGKSTCLKLLTGLEPESSGTLSVLGQRPRSAPRSWRKDIGVLPEHLGLLEALTIEEHLHLTGRVYGLSKAGFRQRSEELLTLLGLAPARHSFASASSYGMRKKTALAMALLPAPKLLILDEPFEGLDPASCETVLTLLNRCKSAGHGIIASSHMLMHVERLASEVLLLDRGHTVWRSASLDEGALRRHYLDIVKATPLPPLNWL